MLLLIWYLFLVSSRSPMDFKHIPPILKGDN